MFSTGVPHSTSGLLVNIACERLGGSGVDRIPVSHCGIELVGEEDGCVIGDLELHGDHRRNSLLYEALSRPGEGIRAPSSAPPHKS